MVTPFNAAANAYSTAAKLISQTAQGGAGVSPRGAEGPDFASFLAHGLQQVVETGARSDQLSLDMVQGRANVVDVVTAVSQTEMAIESMVAVRDKVISAYEEIMRMPI